MLWQLKLCSFCVEFTEVYSEPCQIFQMVLFAKIFNGFQSLTTFVKSSILDVDTVLNMSQNTVTVPPEPVASSNFFLSQL